MGEIRVSTAHPPGVEPWLMPHETDVTVEQAERAGRDLAVAIKHAIDGMRADTTSFRGYQMPGPDERDIFDSIATLCGDDALRLDAPRPSVLIALEGL